MVHSPIIITKRTKNKSNNIEREKERERPRRQHDNGRTKKETHEYRRTKKLDGIMMCCRDSIYL